MKNAQVPTLAPLNRPEIDNHLAGNRWDVKIRSWVNIKGDELSEITLKVADVASDKTSATALVEAALWRALLDHVFGTYNNVGRMCWAGKYQRKLQGLASSLQRDLGSPEKHGNLYHQWRALTASIISVIPQPRDREDEVESIVEEIVGLLKPCEPKGSKFGAYRLDLQLVVAKAIELDLKFAGQRACYVVNWPTQQQYDVGFDEGTMRLATQSPSNSRRVKFMIQPCLWRSREEGGLNDFIVDTSSVWLY
ncbi:hypothetical protein C8034_v009718 [Colletotrichum sidae]|uniref:Uncharacterized protein n=1 Tax=Colletotrichum sidae TaxID=1347389 RepID=A0A4R8PTX1_9PEZI|nr:hypothetical protein C8034_v009718 [Colletotrichum sidae]